jgi:predicted MFS family arabinose efflux permease
LIVLFAINILNFYDRQVLSSLTEPVRKEFALSDTQIGFMTTAFTLLYAVIGLPIGRLTDRWNRKKLLASGVTVWSVLTASTAVAGTYGFLLFSRLGVAVGEAVCAPVGTSWLGDLYPSNKRSGALALFMLGVPIGTALSSLCSGPVAQAFGWRAAMVLAAVPALLLIPALLTLHDPPRPASDRGAGFQPAMPAFKRAFFSRRASESYQPASAQHPLVAQAFLPVSLSGEQSPWSILRIPTLWWIIASGAILNFTMYAFAVFLASFLMRVHGFSLASTGIASACIFGIGGVLGGIASGRVGDRVAVKRKDGRMRAAALAALIAAPLAFFGILQPLGAVAVTIPLLALAYGFFNMYYGFVYPSIQDIVPPSLRGTTMAFYFMVMYLGGASFGSLITGNLSDRLARHAAGSLGVTEAAKAIGLQQAMFIIPAMAIALALVLYAGSRTIEEDMQCISTAPSVSAGAIP